MIIFPLLLGIFLRVYKIGSNYYFSGELGKELLYVRSLVISHSFPLVGLATSHEWLTYGPIYYWILIPLVKIFGSSPFILFWLALTTSGVGIFVTYLVFKKIVDQKFALILSFFISLSPLWVWVSRLSKLHTFFFILTPIFIYFLFKIWKKNVKFIFWLGVVYGALFSFHFSQIPLLAVILGVFVIKRRFLKMGDYIKFAVGLILPNITVLIYDARHHFSMTQDLVVWIPYRIAGFLGIYPKNNLDIASGGSTLASFNEFFGKNLFWDSRVWILGSVVFLALFAVFIIQNHKKITKDFFVFYLILSTGVQLLALLIHTTPPLHYFMPIYLNFGLLFSYYVWRNWEKAITKVLTLAIFLLMFVAGILSLNREHANDADYVPLKTQEAVIQYIVDEAKGRTFSLSRVGPFDYFPENYDQNYQFLILQKGGKIDQSAKLKYIIVEAGTSVSVIKNAGY
jgi:4-amino-4-deoxy-L-arabinose transferase-like glycosyltransferase